MQIKNKKATSNYGLDFLFQGNSEAAKGRKDIKVLQQQGIQQHSADNYSSFQLGTMGNRGAAFKATFSNSQGAVLIKSRGGDTILVGNEANGTRNYGKENGPLSPTNHHNINFSKIKRS